MTSTFHKCKKRNARHSIPYVTDTFAQKSNSSSLFHKKAIFPTPSFRIIIVWNFHR
jgi:hypothetical protein